MTIKIYEVGGSIRDSILGVKSSDRDFSVEAPSYEAMREYILGLGGEIFLETPQYLTIRARVPSLGAADYVLCRIDGAYKDGRHPETVEPGTIYDDLARRDFRINAIARLIGQFDLYDPFDGQGDLDRKVIRCVIDAETSFKDDSLRMFRAQRFAVKYNFNLDYDIRLALRDHKFIGLMRSLPVDRIRQEMSKMFAANMNRSLTMFRTFADFWEFTFTIFPELWLKPTTEQK